MMKHDGAGDTADAGDADGGGNGDDSGGGGGGGGAAKPSKKKKKLKQKAGVTGVKEAWPKGLPTFSTERWAEMRERFDEHYPKYCRFFLNGTCTRKGCKLLHKVPPTWKDVMRDHFSEG